jgi:ParB-like chromosome segregation protein Spo0J
MKQMASGQNNTLKIKMRKAEDLEPVEYNPRVPLTPNHKEYQAIQKSVEVYGVVQPLVVSTLSGRVVGGAQRLTILRDMGVKRIPTIEVTVPTEAQEKALNLALNKISGIWDPDKLEALKEEGIFGLDDLPTGFSMEEVDAIGRRATLPPTPRAVIPVDEEDDVKLYQVVVSCDDKAHQEEVASAIEEMGLTARRVEI